MSSEDINMVSQILSGILNPNDTIRNEATNKLNELKQNVPALSYCLLQILSYNSQISNEIKMTKTVAVVLLRQLLEIKEDELISNKWTQFDPTVKEQIKSLSVQAFINENDKNLKPKIGEVVIQIAINTLESEEKWPDLLALIFDTLKLDCNATENFLHIEGALNIMAGMVGFIYDDLKSQVDLVLSTLRNYFKSSNLTIRTKSAKLVSEMIAYSSEKEVKLFNEFIFLVMETTFKCFEAGFETNLRSCLDIMTEICSQEPSMFNKHFSDLFTLMGNIWGKRDYDNEKIREMAFEVIVNLIERKFVFFTKDPDKLKSFLSSLYNYALEMEKEITSEWATPTANSYDDEEFIYEEKVSTAFSFIDRLIEHMNIKFMLPILSEIVNGLIGNTIDWRYRYIGLLSISHVMSYVDDMAAVENTFPVIFSHLKDPNPKIRYAAMNCVNEMCETFKPYFQTKYKDNVIPLLVEMLTVENVLRVQLEVLDTLHSFITNSTNEILANYVPDLLELSFGLFIKDIPVIMREEILAVITEIATTTGEHFKKFAPNSFKILLEYYVHIYSNKANKSLYGPLVECITLIGPLDEVNYYSIFPDLVKSMIEIVENIHMSTDPIRGYIQDAMERVTPIIQKHFTNFIPNVINSVLLLIKGLPVMSVSSNPDDKFKIEDLLGGKTEDESKKVTSLKTSGTEDISECLELLNTLIESFGKEFLPYIEATQKEIFPLLTYYINEDIRKSACQSLPIMMENISENAKDHAEQYGKLYISTLIATIEKEVDNETLAVQIGCLGDVINSAGMILNKEEVNQLFSKMMTFFDHLEQKRIWLLKRKN